MDFYKNKLINKTLQQYYNTFSKTLDTGDFTPEKFNQKIHKYIYKNLAQKFKEIEIYNLLHLQEQGYQLGIFEKLKIALSGLKPLYLAEQQKKTSKPKTRKTASKKKVQ